jgi:hypothetical protein
MAAADQHVRVPKWLITTAWSLFVSFVVLAIGAASYWLKGIAEDVHTDHALTVSNVAQLTDVRERVMRIEGVFLGGGVRHETRTSAGAATGSSERAIAIARVFGLAGSEADAEPGQAGAPDRVVHGSRGRPSAQPAAEP